MCDSLQTGYSYIYSVDWNQVDHNVIRLLSVDHDKLSEVTTQTHIGQLQFHASATATNLAVHAQVCISSGILLIALPHHL